MGEVQLHLSELRQRYDLEGLVCVVLEGEETGASLDQFEHVLLIPLEPVDGRVDLQH